jgi:pimeloyl-ACP methyl ester carboxylesterase
MRRGILYVLLWSSLLACRTTGSKLSSVADTSGITINDYNRIENPKVRALWEQHIQRETQTLNTSPNKAIQPDCMPRFYPAKEGTERQGMVMFFHGFTACPQQYFDIALMLADRGFDVFLPLMPGQGRTPNGDTDYLNDLPAQERWASREPPPPHPRYVAFVNEMNEIAANSTGVRALAGLSGGGGLATGAVIAGQRPEGNIWSRVLLYAPYYLNPGVQRYAAGILGFIYPGLTNNWGEACRVNRSRPGGRNGYCSVKVENVQAMVQYGQVQAMSAQVIDIPVQIVGVEEDPTADNESIVNALNKIKNARLCFYPKGVPHSIINPARDLIPDDTERFRQLRGNVPKMPYTWVRPMNRDSVNFLTEGVWFPSSGEAPNEKRFLKQAVPLCDPPSL